MSEIAKPLVFVSQYVHSMDFSEAQKHGEVVFLTDKEYRAEPAPDSINDPITNQIKTRFVDYIAGTDFIMTTGSGIPNIIMGNLLKSGEHKVLKWSNQRKTYQLFKVRVP